METVRVLGALNDAKGQRSQGDPYAYDLDGAKSVGAELSDKNPDAAPKAGSKDDPRCIQILLAKFHCTILFHSPLTAAMRFCFLQRPLQYQMKPQTGVVNPAMAMPSQ